MFFATNTQERFGWPSISCQAALGFHRHKQKYAFLHERARRRFHDYEEKRS